MSCSVICNATLPTVQVWEGDGVVKSARKLIGATNPLEAEAGTIRGDFAIQTGRNVVHGSDSPENGIREASKQLQHSPILLVFCEYFSSGIQRHANLNISLMVVCAAELWFGGDDNMVSWQPSLTPWLVE